VFLLAVRLLAEIPTRAVAQSLTGMRGLCALSDSRNGRVACLMAVDSKFAGGSRMRFTDHPGTV
jgi:hypothetical protein